jgi:2-(1,2-epoxy-1,2-dihydrophenyl)acetyl-CoA isomerase
MVVSPNDSIIINESTGICRITFNRPKMLNAINFDMAVALRKVAADISVDKRIRVIIIDSSGDHFMAGGDIKSFKSFLDKKPNEENIRNHFEEILTIIHSFILDLRNMPQPVIGAIKGAVAGAGVSLMLACDLVLASDDAFFNLAYCHLGTSPDGGSTYFLPRTVGLKRAFEMAMLGERFDAKVALEAGMINRIVPSAMLNKEVDKLAIRLAKGPAIALCNTKALLNSSFQRTLNQQLNAETKSFTDCAITQDFFEGVTAFTDKRSAKFVGK